MYVESRKISTDEPSSRAEIKTDVESRPVDTEGRGQGDGMNWAVRFDTKYHG